MCIGGLQLTIKGLKSKAMKKLVRPFWVGELLPQVEESGYLGILFMSEGRIECKIDKQIATSAAVMRSLYPFVVVKKKLS